MADNLVNLIVNYLPAFLSEDDFHGLFQPYGLIVKSKIVRDLNGKSLCYGFVKFEYPESACDAINNLNGIRIYNKILKVAYASPQVPEPQRANNLFIKNLPKTITINELENIFGPFGKIVYIRILYEPPVYTKSWETNSERLSKGLAFVRFEKMWDAINAVRTLDNTKPPGFKKPLQIEMIENTRKSSVSGSPKFNDEIETIYCNQNNKIQSTEQNSAYQTHIMLSMVPTGIHTNVSMVPNNQLYTSQNAEFFECDGHLSQGKNLLVRNLNPCIDEISLFSLFKPYGVLWVKIARRCDGTSRQYGFVEVNTINDAIQAKHQLNGAFFFGYKLSVQQNSNIDSPPYSMSCDKPLRKLNRLPKSILPKNNK